MKHIARKLLEEISACIVAASAVVTMFGGFALASNGSKRTSEENKPTDRVLSYSANDDTENGNIKRVFGDYFSKIDPNTNISSFEEAKAKVRRENILGLASQFNLFVRDNMTIYDADAEGRIAIGGVDLKDNKVALDTAFYHWDEYPVGLGHYLFYNDVYGNINVPFEKGKYNSVSLYENNVDDLIEQVNGDYVIIGNGIIGESEKVQGNATYQNDTNKINRIIVTRDPKYVKPEGGTDKKNNTVKKSGSDCTSDLIDFLDEFAFLEGRSKQLAIDGKKYPTYFTKDDGTVLDGDAKKANYSINGKTYLAKKYTGNEYTVDENGVLEKNENEEKLTAESDGVYHDGTRHFKTDVVNDKHVIYELLKEDSFKYVMYMRDYNNSSYSGSYTIKNDSDRISNYRRWDSVENKHNYYVAHGFGNDKLSEKEPIYINISTAIINAFGGDYSQLIGNNLYYFVPKRSQNVNGFEVTFTGDLNNKDDNGIIKDYYQTDKYTISEKNWEYANIIVNIEGDGELKPPKATNVENPSSEEIKNYLSTRTRIGSIDYAPKFKDIKPDNNNKQIPSDNNLECISIKKETGKLNNQFGCRFILYNFPDATEIGFRSEFQGTVLAPKANIVDTYTRFLDHKEYEYSQPLSDDDNNPQNMIVDKCMGHVSGSIVCKSIDSAMEFGYRSFIMKLSETVGETVEMGSQIKALVLKKRDVDGHPLSGAEFAIFNEGSIQISEATSDEKGIVRFVFDNSLNSGKYTIKETKAPNGDYKLPDDSIVLEFNVTAGEKKYITTSDAGSVGYNSQDITYEKCSADKEYIPSENTINLDVTKIGENTYVIDNSYTVTFSKNSNISRGYDPTFKDSSGNSVTYSALESDIKDNGVITQIITIGNSKYTLCYYPVLNTENGQPENGKYSLSCKKGDITVSVDTLYTIGNENNPICVYNLKNEEKEPVNDPEPESSSSEPESSSSEPVSSSSEVESSSSKPEVSSSEPAHPRPTPDPQPTPSKFSESVPESERSSESSTETMTESITESTSKITFKVDPPEIHDDSESSPSSLTEPVGSMESNISYESETASVFPRPTASPASEDNNTPVPRAMITVPDITQMKPGSVPRGTMVFDEATQQWFFIDDDGIPKAARHFDPDDPSTWYIDDDGVPRGNQENNPVTESNANNPYTGITTTVLGSIAFVVSLGAFIYLRKRK